MSDLISRQAAIDAMNILADKMTDDGAVVMQQAVSVVESLPSVHPGTDEWCPDCKEYDSERHCCPRWNRVIKKTLAEQPVRKGKWYHGEAYPHHLYCSVCYRTALPNDELVERWNLHMNFCPNCGADMRGEEDES